MFDLHLSEVNLVPDSIGRGICYYWELPMKYRQADINRFIVSDKNVSLSTEIDSTDDFPNGRLTTFPVVNSTVDVNV